MPWSTWNRLVQKKRWEQGFSLRKRLTIIDLFEGLRLLGTHFRRQYQPVLPGRSLIEKLVTSPFLAVHGGQYDTKHVTLE